jgi:16S rRNA (cytidine1402-2'-O)-methyltransferase
VLPGASAAETALVASGFSFERYQFIGYLPRGERALGALWAELAAWPHAVVAFESPQRLPKTIESLVASLPERHIAVCRELTKAFEEVVRGLPAEVLAAFREPPKGEITLVISPAAAVSSDAQAEEAATAVAELVAAGLSRRDAADLVSRLTSIPRGRLYRRSL